MSNKIETINLLVDKYFIESKNPLVNLVNKRLGEPVTKDDMKIKLINELK